MLRNQATHRRCARHQSIRRLPHHRPITRTTASTGNRRITGFLGFADIDAVCQLARRSGGGRHAVYVHHRLIWCVTEKPCLRNWAAFFAVIAQYHQVEVD